MYIDTKDRAVDPNDRQFRESRITAVRETTDGYELTGDDGWSLYVSKVEGLPAPRVGETLRCYGAGIGSAVRGVVIDGRVYRYLTEAQENARHKAWVQEQEAKREQELTATLIETDRRIAALPALFQERIKRFQRDGGHTFRRDYEGYELFCCEQAVVLVEALRSVDAIKAFRDLPWNAQRQLVPGLSEDHSGNTFGAACMLARTYLEQPEYVPKLHGALTPLVGCEAYGCKH